MTSPEPFPQQGSGLTNEELAAIARITPEDLEQAIAQASPQMREAIRATLLPRRRGR